MNTFHHEWLWRLKRLSSVADTVAPRGQVTRELIDERFCIDSRFNILDVPARKLNYRFMVAEWVWMMFGHSDVESVAKYNSKMREYSDDGVFLTGAYGPHINAQRFRVLRKLTDDPVTRQAVIEIPRPQGPTKDEPCTLSLQFLRRDGFLHLIVTMRSSDVWLGIPYDVFTFSMIQNCFAGVLGDKRGLLSMRMGSSHLYTRDLPGVEQVLDGEPPYRSLATPDLPGLPPQWLDDVLLKGERTTIAPSMDARRHSKWWPFAQVLLAKSSDEALAILRGQQ